MGGGHSVHQTADATKRVQAIAEQSQWPLVLRTIAAIMLKIRQAGGPIMGAFIAACVAFIVLGAGGYFALNEAQQPSGAAYSTQATRIEPNWSWRAAGEQSCEPRQSWQWFFVDFRRPRGESPLCSDSQ
jgi:hypothetical protein